MERVIGKTFGLPFCGTIGKKGVIMKGKEIYYTVGSATGIISVVILIYMIGVTLGGITTKIETLWEADLPDLKVKVDRLWEIDKTRRDILEKTFMNQARQSGSKSVPSYPNSFLLAMKTNDIKKVLNSQMSREDKVFNVINKIGGLEELERLTDTENSMEAIGKLVLFVENYSSS